MEKKKRNRPTESFSSNPAKSTSPHKKGSKKKGKSNKLGIAIAMIQLLASIGFSICLFVLNMLPVLYLGVVIGVLLALFGITLATQLRKKKKGTGGKVFGIILIIILLFASYYVVKANGAVKKISGGEYKIDNIVVAVLEEDSAKTIEDAKDYDFGVQYATGGDHVKQTVDAINKKVKSDISTVEFKGLSQQAEALHDGKVTAIIYNEAYTGMLEEAFEGYSEKVRIIYTNSIKTKLENKVNKVAVKDDTFSVFISGIDVYGPIASNSRSDVNIIATINPTTHQVLLTTTPRDYYVEIPEVSGGQKDKLTHAGVYGVDASMRTLSALYDTDIDFYARVNFTSLIEMVDILGGIEVYSEQAFSTSPETQVSMSVQQGMNIFNGKQALAFSRERMNIDGGDNQRGKNQQAVITAMIKKMISPAILVNAGSLIDSASGNVETNMSSDQIQDLIKQQLGSGAAWNIYSAAADGTADSQFCFSYAGAPLYVTQPDQTSVDTIKALMKSVKAGEQLPAAETAQ